VNLARYEGTIEGWHVSWHIFSLVVGAEVFDSVCNGDPYVCWDIGV
jgi:hypothetical protein